ncbi:hypothetical protein AB0N24_27090 [Arthrobacter sp. NPDC093128]|uniref:hypothetical protein n=1 Tax=Arthrobacter sp. NPDC093128 TaxID=3154979 RepID=UPI0034225E2D
MNQDVAHRIADSYVAHMRLPAISGIMPISWQANFVSTKKNRTLRCGVRLVAAMLRTGRFRGVDTVHIFSFGLGRTSVGLARIAYVFWSSQ